MQWPSFCCSSHYFKPCNIIYGTSLTFHLPFPSIPVIVNLQKPDRTIDSLDILVGHDNNACGVVVGHMDTKTGQNPGASAMDTAQASNTDDSIGETGLVVS